VLCYVLCYYKLRNLNHFFANSRHAKFHNPIYYIPFREKNKDLRKKESNANNKPICGKGFLLSGNALFNGKNSVRKSGFFKEKAKIVKKKESVIAEKMYKYNRKIGILRNLFVLFLV
jgi:hypothetical protein